MAFTKLTASVAIITALANQIRGQASYVKGKFDEAPGIIKTFLNDTFIAELESTTNGSSGADNVGCTTVLTGGGTTVQSNLEAVYAEVVVVAGTGIANDSVTEAKMAADMKKAVGGVAPYTHVTNTSNPHSVTAAQIGAANILTQLLTVDVDNSGLNTTTLQSLTPADMGLEFVAGTTFNVYAVTGSVNTTSISYIEARGGYIPKKGSLRVSFDMASYVSGSAVYGRIYKNSAAVGTERTTTLNTYTTYTEDIVIAAEDRLSIYYKSSVGTTNVDVKNVYFQAVNKHVAY